MKRTTPVVGVHLDLKYQMPKKSYLLEWVRRLPEFGVNALLLEYEDKFPFACHPFLRDREAFTAKELRAFLSAARGAGVRVIPLVQTLSHLEFALAHNELKGLREREDIHTQICPSNPKAVQFVHDLLDDVLAYHEEDEWFHVGADEAWSLGACKKCAPRVKNGKVELWLEHMQGICGHIMSKGKRPLLWDDTFWASQERVKELPREAILCSWNYSVTEIHKDKNPYACMAAYRKAGFDVLGCPCGNWGELITRAHALKNTQVFAELVRKERYLGLLNTNWACFHVPLPASQMQVAATGAAMAARPAKLDEAWEERFLAKEFGVRIKGLAGALRTLGETWEVRVEGFARPLAPLVYCYMDMVAAYPGGHEDRRKRGAYPLRWREVDFNALRRRKLELFRALPEEGRKAMREKLDWFLANYPAAVEKMQQLAKSATSHRKEAELLAALAALKLAAARALDASLFGGPMTEARQAWQACKLPLERSLADFHEPFSVKRLMAIWWAPVDAALKARPREKK